MVDGGGQVVVVAGSGPVVKLALSSPSPVVPTRVYGPGVGESLDRPHMWPLASPVVQRGSCR